MVAAMLSAVPTSQPQRVLVIALLSYLLIVLDVSVVLTGLPDIQEDFDLSSVALSWVQNAYLLAFGGTLLLGARLGDLVGRTHAFLAGLAVFTLSSLAIGLAPSAAWLIGARALQGLGAAVVAPTVLALISSHFAEGPARDAALGRYAMAAGAGSSLGLVLGGACADQLSWRVGFLVNVPIGLALGLAAWRAIPNARPPRRGALDVAGAVTSTLGMVALVYGIVRAAERGFRELGTLTTLVFALVMLASFVAIEARAAEPMIPLRLFASRARSGAYLTRALFLGSLVGCFFFTTQYLQLVLGLSPLAAGFAFLPMTLTNFVAALVAPKLARRIGHGATACLACVVLAIGLAWLAAAGAEPSYVRDVAVPMAIAGLGNGLGLAPLTALGVHGVAERDQGAASGVVNVFHQLGGSLGLGLLVVVFSASTTAGLGERVALAMNGAAVLALLGGIVALVSTALAPRSTTRRASALVSSISSEERQRT